MPQTPADYIALYSARKSPFSMTPPWKHPNPLIRALSAKQERWVQERILKMLGREQSHSRDVAYDAYVFEQEKHRSIIQTAWDRRPKPHGSANLAGVDAALRKRVA